MKEIYQQTVEEVFERVKGNISGLTSEQVKSSREKCGWNEFAEGKKKNILQIFLEQYKDFLVLVRRQRYCVMELPFRFLPGNWSLEM